MEINKLNESTGKQNWTLLLVIPSLFFYTCFFILSALYSLYLVWRGFPNTATGKKKDYYIVVQRMVFWSVRETRDSYHTWKNSSKKALIFTVHVAFSLRSFHLNMWYHPAADLFLHSLLFCYVCLPFLKAYIKFGIPKTNFHFFELPATYKPYSSVHQKCTFRVPHQFTLKGNNSSKRHSSWASGKNLSATMQQSLLLRDTILNLQQLLDLLALCDNLSPAVEIKKFLK